MEFPQTAATPQRKSFRSVDYVKITILGLAITTLWGSLHSIVLPMQLLDLVPDAEKNARLGYLTLAGLLLAMMMQPAAGALSDRSRLSWGRRRPFILSGILASVMLLPGLALAESYLGIFIIYGLLQMSANVAQGPYQALIPDLVPAHRRGVASAVKSLFETIGGVALVWALFYFAGRTFPSGGPAWQLFTMSTLAGLLLGTMLITVSTVREQAHVSVRPFSPLSSLRASFRIDMEKDRNFLIFMTSRFVFVMALATLQSFSFYYVTDVINAVNPAVATAELLVALGVGMVVSIYPAGRLSDAIGRKPVLVFSGVIGAIGVLVILAAPSYWYLVAGVGIQGVAGGAFMASNWALATDLVPKSEAARFLGLANMATAGGAAMARLIGPLIDYFNRYEPGLGYTVMFLACLLYFVIGSLLTLRIKEGG